MKIVKVRVVKKADAEKKEVAVTPEDIKRRKSEFKQLANLRLGKFNETPDEVKSNYIHWQWDQGVMATVEIALKLKNNGDIVMLDEWEDEWETFPVSMPIKKIEAAVKRFARG